ncbi:Predicted dehydrogenase [Prauserella marina]|uniref:Predicted dehydrogenase n=2 Tax=Prauserella marina TaxID=530584 RepID=A0A1G6UML6_9PSEU|nr:Gfo/Idh/MocA family oxidoreductase [Prauserella marina]PWV74745.1 putative dehydrogenase [Prauserella marina]SDD41807.1 Predicted dehydrogenase [Prauserella marina]
MRVLVVGAGLMGGLHAKAVKHSDTATLCGVVDLDIARVGVVAADLGAPGFTDLSRALAELKPDVAIIATPDSAHRVPASMAIEAGISVLVEKPLATTVDDAMSMVELAERRRVGLMTAHLTRFYPRYLAVADAVESGDLGAPVMLTTSTWGPRGLGERVSATTNPLWHLAIHDIDTIQWLTGGVIAEVDGAQLIESASGAAAFAATGVLSTGAGFHLAAGWTLPEGAAPRWDLKVHGESGVAQAAWSSDGVAVYTPGRVDNPDCLAWPEARGSIQGALRAELDHFINSTVNDRPYAITTDEAVDAVRSAALLEKCSSIRRVS